jgi:hypothetical protein
MTAMIDVEALGRELRVGQTGLLVAGGDDYQVQFTFSPDWTGLEKTVAYRCCGVELPGELGEDGVSPIPTQILSGPGVLYVKLSGQEPDGEVRRTPWTRVGVVFFKAITGTGAGGTASGGHDLPAGGAKGTVLMKASSEDYDVTWGRVQSSAQSGGSDQDGLVVLTVPTQSGRLTYSGETQSPAWSDYDDSLMILSGSIAAIDAGTYQATFELIDPDGCQWSDGTTEPKAVNWSISKAVGSLTVPSSFLIDTRSAQTLTVTRAGDGAVSAVVSDESVATVTVYDDVLTLTPRRSGVVTLTVSVAAGTNHTAASSQVCTLTVDMPAVYGAQWDGTSTTKWTRTDDAELFTDPVPYVSGASSWGSPFDNLQPWAGMAISERTGGTMVSIPKFWYKLTQNGSAISIQISDKAVAGFSVSPAHMDRGDGKGERDIVYVGRYHCASSNYKSVSGETPKVSITRSSARTAIHALGDNIWQSDFAMRFTIWLLYIVEFADWNSQATIGMGTGNNKSVEDMGYTDSMPYHTGTTQESRNTYGLGTQYRWIEGLWDMVFDWTDGCYYASSGMNIILNPNSFSDSTGGTSVGTPTGGFPTAFTVSKTGGFPMFYASAKGGDSSTYSCDCWYFSTSSPCVCVGGYYNQSGDCGLFYLYYYTSTTTYAYSGSRLQELP